MGIVHNNTNQTRKLDPNSNAIVLSSKQVTVRAKNGTMYTLTVPVSSVIFATDYTRVQLRYACGTVRLAVNETQGFSYYFVLVRNRNFTDLEVLEDLMDENLKKRTNDIAFMFNQPSCIN
jgi:hypothetical protein